MKKFLLLSASLFCCLLFTCSQAAELDSSFGNNGFVTNESAFYTNTVVQKDGKVVVIGYLVNGPNDEDYFLTRYTSNGRLDRTFGDDGIRRVKYYSIRAVALQLDQKIVVVAGDSLARLNSDGTFDAKFGNKGELKVDFGARIQGANAITIQKDGKIVVVGSVFIPDTDMGTRQVFGLARYNVDGSPDSTFSDDGKQIADFNGVSSVASSVALQKDGKIVVVGTINNFRSSAISLARFNIDGSLDIMQTTSYNDAFAGSVAIQSDGKIVVGGSALYRFNTDGTLDDNFLQPSPNSYNSLISIQSDDKIVAAGETGNYVTLARFNTDGSFDSTFNGNGIRITTGDEINRINNLTIYENKLYAVGFFYKSSTTYGVIARFSLIDNISTPPTVSITTPTNNATYLAPAAHIKISATASDADGTISKVEFYNGTHLLHTETVVPYGFVWRNVRLGNYTLTAKATDNSGLVTTSAPVHISVVPNKPPTVSIIRPKNNQPFAAPAYVHFEADAKDLDGRITRVEFYNGSTLLRTEYKLPYTYVWRNLPVGTYTITAVATDNWGAHTTSAPVTFRVIPRNTTIVSNRPSSVNNKTGISDAVSVRLAPNPANSMVNIYTTGLQQNKPATISVISASGVVMKTMRSNSSAKTIQLDVSSLESGVYTIKLISGDKVMYKQFVKL